MFIRPVGAGSLLASRFAQHYLTPRVLRWGLAQSLLAYRLRRRAYWLGSYSPRVVGLGQERPSAAEPVKVAPSKPIDRYWPSDRPEPVAEVEVERRSPAGIESVVGSVLDLWM